jgi:hypothetical protein
VQADVADRAVHRAGDVAAVVDRAVAGFDLAGGLVFERGRDALVDDVDQAADRAGAVEQGGGPRRISIWRATAPSEATAWSFDRPDTSEVAMPFSSILTREPSMPRMIGREAPAPKAEADTPSSFCRVSPSELPTLSRSSSPASTLAGVRIWSPSRCAADWR